jgi:hypothetical protein
MTIASPELVAGWLAEALETGAPLAPLPGGAEPADVAAGERVAALVLDSLGLAPCGLRLARGPTGEMLAGPVLEGRLLPDGAAVALATARHAAVAPGVMGVLAEELAPGEGRGALPAFSALHPIFDVSAWRLRERPGSPGLAAADLSGHGFIVAGRGKPEMPLDAVPVGVAPAGARRRPQTHDVAAALREAADAARRSGGLPRGAVLAVVLGTGVAPREGQELVGAFGALGRVRAVFR